MSDLCVLHQKENGRRFKTPRTLDLFLAVGIDVLRFKIVFGVLMLCESAVQLHLHENLCGTYKIIHILIIIVCIIIINTYY